MLKYFKVGIKKIKILSVDGQPFHLITMCAEPLALIIIVLVKYFWVWRDGRQFYFILKRPKLWVDKQYPNRVS